MQTFEMIHTLDVMWSGCVVEDTSLYWYVTACVEVGNSVSMGSGTQRYSEMNSTVRMGVEMVPTVAIEVVRALVEDSVPELRLS